MDVEKDPKVCNSCLQFMKEGNRLKKQIREMLGAIKLLNKKPVCKSCTKDMEKSDSKSHSINKFKLERYEVWICRPCLIQHKKDKIESNEKWN